MSKIVIIGSQGKMAQVAKEAISYMSNSSIVALVNRGDNLESTLKSHKPDIAIDLTSFESVYNNTLTIINAGVRPVIGTSGLTQAQIEKLSELCMEKKLGGLIIPNFSLAFAYINRLTKELSPHYSDFSIVEFHHEQKKDAPSGTARHTANLIHMDENKIASVRSNGFLAKQQIYICSSSERIIIDHESFNRNSFLKGIQVSLTKVVELHNLVVGLENILH